MNVNVEFLDQDSIENVITSLHYQMDKTIFFGYQEIIEEKRLETERFLKKYCEVGKVEFIEISQNNLNSVVTVIAEKVKKELNGKNKVFIDITGGESLSLVAFGMVSKELGTPIHMYNVELDELLEFSLDETIRMSKLVPNKRVKLSIKKYIEMYGGKIIHDSEENSIDTDSEEVYETAEKIWSVARKYKEHWNSFSDFIRTYFRPEEGLRVQQSMNYVTQMLTKRKKRNCLENYHRILSELNAKGIIKSLQYNQRLISFWYGSKMIQDILWKGGSILEFHTFYKEKQNADDCAVSVKIDWDGEIHREQGIDVYNEIDVLKLNGNILTFISCKSGNLEGPMALHALYELGTVTQRFGGKYAKKEIAIMQELGSVQRERAEEMEIKIRDEGK